MVNLVQIGMGGMGETWLKTVLASSEARYCAFVEVNDEVARTQVAKYKLDGDHVYRTLPEALRALASEGKQVDGVLIITPPRFHKEQSIQALEAGLPVLSEKPLADTIEAARDIVEMAERTGKLHVVAQNYRYSQPVQTLRATLGELGKVGAVCVQFFKGPHFGGFREEMPYPLIVDMSIHHFDMMRYLLDADLVSLKGYSWNPEWSWYKGDASATLGLRLESRQFGPVYASYTASWCSRGSETPWNGNWRFECENGVINLVDDMVRVQESGTEPRLIEPVPLAHSGQAYLLHEFIQALQGGPAPATRCQDNIKSLEIVFQALHEFAAH